MKIRVVFIYKDGKSKHTEDYTDESQIRSFKGWKILRKYKVKG